MRKEKGVNRAGVHECREGPASEIQTEILQGQFRRGNDVEDVG